MAFADFVIEDQRLRLLEMLAQDPEGSHNTDVLRSGLEALGHGGISARHVRDLVDWLAGRGLVALEDRGGVPVARITERGEDVALGGCSVPGVARPRKRF